MQVKPDLQGYFLPRRSLPQNLPETPASWYRTKLRSTWAPVQTPFRALELENQTRRLRLTGGLRIQRIFANAPYTCSWYRYLTYLNAFVMSTYFLWCSSATSSVTRRECHNSPISAACNNAVRPWSFIECKADTFLERLKTGNSVGF